TEILSILPIRRVVAKIVMPRRLALPEGTKTRMVRGKLLTPKELADAIGASESSLRRWVDSGDIRMSRTAGGHRRIPLREAIRFVRAIGATVVRPDILGLGELGRAKPALLNRSGEDALFEALRAGEAEAAT